MAADAGRRAPAAPAVARAVQILEYLASTKPEAGTSEIAAALGMNKSTCFNILRTLADETMVIKDSRYPVYRLGPRLVELGTASRRNFSHRQHLGEMIRPLVEELGITCLIAQPLPGDRGSIVVDRVIPRGKDVLTAPIGKVYPISAPAMGRVLLAARDVEEVLANVHNLPETSESDILGLLDSLDIVRTKGYGWSEEEYQSEVNAVAAGVFNASREVAIVLCLIGEAAQFPADRIDAYGQRLRAVADQIEGVMMRDGARLAGGL